MSKDDHGVIRKRFDAPDETRQMELGHYELVRIGGQTVGRATYQPGWKWSEHVGPGVGKRLCDVEHVGLVLEGTCTVTFDDGTVIELRAGDAFYVPPTPHDSWVVGRSRTCRCTWRAHRPTRSSEAGLASVDKCSPHGALRG